MAQARSRHRRECPPSVRHAARAAIEKLEPRSLLAGVPVAGGVPVLNSRAGATAALYLDFNGDAAGQWGVHSVPVTPAYDSDGDAATFSATELSAITEIWARVAEKFSPFNLNVTTVDPGNLTDFVTLRAVIGGNGQWAGGPTGTSSLGSFYTFFYPNTVYAFSTNIANGNPQLTAEITAHESGHGFGLTHQSLYSGTTRVNEYNPGNASRAPIMGNSLYSARGLWWLGATWDSTAMQDDLSVLSGSSNAFGYRSDDHANATTGATALAVSGNLGTGSGVITQTSDRDYFSFTTTGGSVSITGAVAQYGAMLDLKLELRDAAGNLVTSADTATLGETISTSLAAGTYYVVVASHGSYGDIGQYTLTATLPSGTPSTPVANAGGPYSVNEGGSVQLSASLSTGTGLSYAWDLDGDGVYGETGAGALRGSESGVTPTFSAVGLDQGARMVSLRVTDSSSQTSTTSATVNVANVAPTLSISGAASVSEGATYTLNLSATDPGPDTITSWLINWGDGSTQTVSGSPSSVAHTFAVAANRTITASASDEDGTYAAGTSVAVQVTAAPPVASAGGPYTVNEGGSITLSGASSTGTGLTYAWDLDGDALFGETGSSAARGNEVGIAPTFSAAALNDAVLTMSLRVTDSQGRTSTNTATLTVLNVVPTITVSRPANAVVGSAFVITSSAADPGPDTVSLWQIAWGDGTVDTLPGGATATAAHVYAAAGTYSSSITAIGSDGIETRTLMAVTVLASDTAGPTATAGALPMVTAEGDGSYTFTVTYADVTAVSRASLGSQDVAVTGPNGFEQMAALVSVSHPSDQSTLTATYRIAAPGNAWTLSHNGTYLISLQGNQVGDISGNFSAAGTLGTFAVSVPGPDYAGNDRFAARNTKNYSPGRTAVYRDYVGPADVQDYYRFKVVQTSVVSIKIYDLTSDASLQIRALDHKAIKSSARAGTRYELITLTLQPGSYYARVISASAVQTPYAIRIAVTAPPAPAAPAPKIASIQSAFASGPMIQFGSTAGPKPLSASELLLLV